MPAAAEITLDQLPAFLNQLGVDILSFEYEAIFKQIGLALENGIKDCFNAGRSPDNQPWSPLKHPRPRGGNQPLLDRGLLRASFTSSGKNHVDRREGNTLTWGTNVISAAVHNYGAVITPKKGKYLAIPASVEAVRAGSPRNFPNAKARLQIVIGKKGTGGLIYERPKKKKKGKRGSTGARTPRRRPSRLMKRFGKIVKGVKRFGKRLKRYGSKTIRMLKKTARRIRKLTRKLHALQKRLRSVKSGTKAAMIVLKAIRNTKRDLKNAQEKYRQLKLTKVKNAKIDRGKPNQVYKNVNGQMVLVHYFLTKKVDIPARPFLGISENTQDVILQIIKDQIIKQLNKKYG